jgi:hypothetical protein
MALCPWCKKNKVFEPHSFAVLSGGAMLMDKTRENGGPDDRLDAFLSLSWHGAHDNGKGNYRDINEMTEIARDVRGGQFDIYFCSTKCLRAYLNYCIDKLEKKIKKK